MVLLKKFLYLLELPPEDGVLVVGDEGVIVLGYNETAPNTFLTWQYSGEAVQLDIEMMNTHYYWSG